MNKRILLIDGDIIAYLCAAAAEERSILVTHQPTGITKSFKTRTAFKKVMKEKNKEITEDYTIEDQQEAESPAFCFKVIRQKIEKIVRETKADEFEVYAEDENNFRLDLPLPSAKDVPAKGRYKGQRETMIRPLLLSDAKDYLKRVYGSKKSSGHETDDTLSIRGYEELAKGNIPIVSTIDKDAYQGDKLSIYNFDDDKPKVVEVPELGSLRYKAPTVKGDGLKFLCFQWLWGDSSDNYHGYQLANTVFGAKSAYDLLVDVQSVKECLEIVIQKYKEWYPEPFEYTSWDEKVIKADWKFMLDLYFKCCWMKRRIDDPSDPKELFDKYGVLYE